MHMTSLRALHQSMIATRSDIQQFQVNLGEASFDTWMRWDRESNRRPSAENRHKTLLLLGPDALAFSEQINASSRWSSTDTKRGWKDNAH